MIDYNAYQIAAGHDNTAGLQQIKLLIGATPAGFGEHDDGLERIKPTGIVVFGGYEYFEWPFAGVELRVPMLLSNLFCAGTRTGYVTVQSYIDNPDIPYRYNATLKLPPLTGLRRNTGGGILIPNYIPRFVRAVRIA